MPQRDPSARPDGGALRAVGRVPGRVAASIRGFWGRVAAAYSPSGLLFASVVAFSFALLGSAVIAHYYENDVIASLSYLGMDSRCIDDDLKNGLGLHCFGDYSQVVDFAFRANPWSAGEHDLGSIYPAAGMLPQLIFGGIGFLFGAPRIGLALYLIALAVALFVPAVWAGRGKAYSLQLVAIALFGVVSIPAIMTLDRGNNVGFVVPAFLAYLVALRRGNHTAVMIAIVAATLIKPQFVILVFVFMALRMWKRTFLTIGIVVATNLLAYLAWPRVFPGSILESIGNALAFNGVTLLDTPYPANMSFSRGVYAVDAFVRSTLGLPPNEWLNEHGGVVGIGIALAIIAAVVVLGKRLPIHLGAIFLLAAASMFQAATYGYYLVFALAVAAVIMRDPAATEVDRYRWSGVLDPDGRNGWRGVSVGLIAFATAVSLTRLLLPHSFTVEFVGLPTRSDLVATSGDLTPMLWLIAIVVSLLAWTLPQRRRAELG